MNYISYLQNGGRIATLKLYGVRRANMSGLVIKVLSWHCGDTEEKINRAATGQRRKGCAYELSAK